MEISWERIITALGLAIGGIGGMIPIFNAIVTRWDKRKERIATEKALELSESVDARGIALEEKKNALAEWMGVAENYKQELIDERIYSDNLEKEILELKKQLDDCQKHHKIILDEIDIAMRNLHVAQFPDEAVQVLVAKINQVRKIISDARDI